MNAACSEPPPLETALKTIGGASRWPGAAESNLVVPHPLWQETLRRLDQLAAVRAHGVLHGPHGAGKSYLVHHWSRRLSPKQHRLLRLTHSSLMGSDLLRQLVKLAGKTAQLRRGDNVLCLGSRWQEWAPLWPVIIVEEAQDLNVAALEELRLLTCCRSDAQPPFSLPLVGDQDLLPRLELGVNRALVSRLGFCLQLERWSAESLGQYLQARLEEAGLHLNPLEPAAQTLLLQSAQGSPRSCNALLQRAMEQAARAKRREVTPADVQSALDTLPWLARALPPR